MKQGSTDDPFAEEPDDGTDAEETDTAASEPEAGANETTGTADTTETAGTTDTSTLESTHETVQRGSLPYIHARDGVKDGRTQRPVFLRDHVEAGIDDLVAEMEAELGEDVYKTDVTEAAMAVAQENPELVLAKLEEWGYGWS
ncbi:hypothetical protein [Halosimplex marinum]|uniref:hypothetical protein n=1 Tax=Halosimplex marinum TaxID=3396620 RepID=UPI003F548F2E